MPTSSPPEDTHVRPAAPTPERKPARFNVVDVKHLGLIVSVGAAVALRFFSDFSFSTIEHQAALAHAPVDEASLASFARLSLVSLSYQLERDWFNLSPQAPFEVVGFVVLLAVAYVLLRRFQSPEPAAAAVMLSAPFIALAATFLACASVLLRTASA
jgi:hypothetical protein